MGWCLTRQAITSTDDGPVHWRIYALLDLNDLVLCPSVWRGWKDTCATTKQLTVPPLHTVDLACHKTKTDCKVKQWRSGNWAYLSAKFNLTNYGWQMIEMSSTDYLVRLTWWSLRQRVRVDFSAVRSKFSVKISSGQYLYNLLRWNCFMKDKNMFVFSNVAKRCDGKAEIHDDTFNGCKIWCCDFLMSKMLISRRVQYRPPPVSFYHT